MNTNFCKRTDSILISTVAGNGWPTSRSMSLPHCLSKGVSVDEWTRDLQLQGLCLQVSVD